MPRPPKYTDDDVRAAVAASPNITAALRRLGLRTAGGNHRTLKRHIERLDLSTEHFRPFWYPRTPTTMRQRSLAELLVPNSHYKRASLKRRLYAAGMKTRACEMCGQGERWCGKRMSLILDHINGIATDNRLENLRIVCPNCNATLDTHCGRKNRIEYEPRACLHCGEEFAPRYEAHRYCSRACGVHSKGPRKPRPERRKVLRPSEQQLRADLTDGSFVSVGRKYGVTDNAVRKWLRYYEYQREMEEWRAQEQAASDRQQE